MNTGISSKRSSQIFSLARERATEFSDDSWRRMVEPLGWSWWSWPGRSWTWRTCWRVWGLAMGPGQSHHSQNGRIHVVPEAPRQTQKHRCSSHGAQRHNHGASQRLLHQQTAGWRHSCDVRYWPGLAHRIPACGPASVGLVPYCLVQGGNGGGVSGCFWCDYVVNEWWKEQLLGCGGGIGWLCKGVGVDRFKKSSKIHLSHLNIPSK